jgi:hypothetical protein
LAFLINSREYRTRETFTMVSLDAVFLDIDPSRGRRGIVFNEGELINAHVVPGVTAAESGLPEMHRNHRIWPSGCGEVR